MKLRSQKIGELTFNGTQFEIHRRTDERQIYVEYVLTMKWREWCDDRPPIHRQKQIGKYYHLSEATDRLAEIVRINNR